MLEGETGRQKAKILICEFRKARHDLRDISKKAAISDERAIACLRTSIAIAREVYEAQVLTGMTPDEFYVQKAQRTVKKAGSVFEAKSTLKEPLTSPDLSEIPLWQGFYKNGKALEFLSEHYGQWLSAFGAEKDLLFQDRIKRHDRKLMKGLRTQLESEGKIRRVRDFVKPRSVRVDQDYDNVNADDLERKRRLAEAIRMRRFRSAKRARPPQEDIIKKK